MLPTPNMLRIVGSENIGVFKTLGVLESQHADLSDLPCPPRCRTDQGGLPQRADPHRSLAQGGRQSLGHQVLSGCSTRRTTPSCFARPRNWTKLGCTLEGNRWRRAGNISAALRGEDGAGLRSSRGRRRGGGRQLGPPRPDRGHHPGAAPEPGVRRAAALVGRAKRLSQRPWKAACGTPICAIRTSPALRINAR